MYAIGVQYRQRTKSIVVIIETSIFTRQLQSLLSDEEYRQLQLTLVHHPNTGAVIPDGGGLRKVRWSL